MNMHDSLNSLTLEETEHMILEVAGYDKYICNEKEKKKIIRHLTRHRSGLWHQKQVYTDEVIEELQKVNDLFISYGLQCYRELHQLALLLKEQCKHRMPEEPFFEVRTIIKVDVDSMKNVTNQDKALYRAILDSANGYNDGIFSLSSTIRDNFSLEYDEDAFLYLLYDKSHPHPNDRNWNEGTEQEKTKDMNLCYAFHLLYDDVGLSIPDILRITKLTRTFHIEYEIN